MAENQNNFDVNVVKDFGSEWSRFDQSGLPATDYSEIFDDYFRIFPWAELSSKSIGADIPINVRGTPAGRVPERLRYDIARLQRLGYRPTDSLALEVDRTFSILEAV